MERDQLIQKLKAAQKNLAPGDVRVFDYEQAIAGLTYPDEVAYGHAPLHAQRVKKNYFLKAYELLGLTPEEQ